LNALRRTFAILIARPRTAAWTLVAIVCALTVAAIALVVVDNIDGWTAAPRTGGGSMVVYLGEGVSDANAQILANQLSHVAGVDHAELVSPAEAAKRLERALGADAALLDGVDLASLPPTVEVTLAPGVRDVIAMSPLLRALRGTPGVDDVIVEDGGDAAPHSFAGMRAFLVSGAALLAGLALVVVLAAIRVRLERDRQEHAVLHLLGASPAFSAVPAALAGALLGLCASLAASLLVWLGVQTFGDELASALSVHSVSAPALGAIALFVATSAGIGLVGGSLAGVARVAR
jgi:cell division transport system permease protein